MACEPCTDLINRWMDTQPSTLIPRPAVALTGGTGYDSTPAGVADKRRSHYEQWRRTVRDGIAAVRAACAAGRHAEPRGDN